MINTVTRTNYDNNFFRGNRYLCYAHHQASRWWEATNAYHQGNRNLNRINHLLALKCSWKNTFLTMSIITFSQINLAKTKKSILQDVMKLQADSSLPADAIWSAHAPSDGFEDILWMQAILHVRHNTLHVFLHMRWFLQPTQLCCTFKQSSTYYRTSPSTRAPKQTRSL